ncbi:MAG: phosphohistidine phosphatase SixA [Planctomycetota bacterium]|jgi:phosphohistidine phosphatase
MILYLVQHAKATSKDVDSERPLTDEGRDEAKLIANFVRGSGLSVWYIWHSGKKRAIQTAEILSEAFHLENSIKTRDDLGPNDDAGKIETEVNSIEHDVLIVGHMPFLSRLASRLLCGNQKSGTVTFKNAGIICLRRDEENRWHLDWSVIPQLVGKTI